MCSSTVKERLTSELMKAADVKDRSLVQWSVPKREGQGDYSTNLAMMLAKQRKQPPRALAEDWINKINWSDFGVEKAEVAGPGFINLWLGPKYFQNVVADILDQQSEFGRTSVGEGKSVLVEFVSANPTGPLNVVSARAAAIGDSLVRLLRKAGFHAEAEFYVNDAGRQVRRLGASVIARARGEEVPEDGYHGDDVQLLAEKIFSSAPSDDTDPDEAGKKAADINVAHQKEVLEKYGVVFNTWFRESNLHDQKLPEIAFEKLKKLDAVYEKDGAWWFAGTKYGDVEDRVIITSEGRPTYLLPDIAYHLNKAERGFTTGIDLLGPDHLDYVGRMQAALKALEHEGFLETIIVQQVHLIEGGQKIKMSKRAGKLVTLEELVSEVGKDVARYFFLQRRTSTPLEFDLDLAKEQSDRNPVFYVQYAHTRICGILRQRECPDPYKVSVDSLKEPEEIALIKHLEQFGEVIGRAAESREPQKMVGYLHDLATAFHKFYTAHRVIGTDKSISSSRASLIEAARIVLAEGLNLLGFSALERM